MMPIIPQTIPDVISAWLITTPTSIILHCSNILCTLSIRLPPCCCNCLYTCTSHCTIMNICYYAENILDRVGFIVDIPENLLHSVNTCTYMDWWYCIMPDHLMPTCLILRVACYWCKLFARTGFGTCLQFVINIHRHFKIGLLSFLDSII